MGRFEIDLVALARSTSQGGGAQDADGVGTARGNEGDTEADLKLVRRAEQY